MTTPTKDQLNTMDYAYQGSPFVNVQSKDNQDTQSLDYSFQGLPFVGAYNATYNSTQFFMVF